MVIQHDTDLMACASRCSDTLWGQTRNDNGQIFYASLVKRDFYIFGLTPVIEANYQTNQSNINFFTYNKFFVGLYFKNVY
jgi:hypothetical protein